MTAAGLSVAMGASAVAALVASLVIVGWVSLRDWLAARERAEAERAKRLEDMRRQWGGVDV